MAWRVAVGTSGCPPPRAPLDDPTIWAGPAGLCATVAPPPRLAAGGGEPRREPDGAPTPPPGTLRPEAGGSCAEVSAATPSPGPLPPQPPARTPPPGPLPPPPFIPSWLPPPLPGHRIELDCQMVERAAAPTADGGDPTPDGRRPPCWLFSGRQHTQRGAVAIAGRRPLNLFSVSGHVRCSPPPCRSFSPTHRRVAPMSQEPRAWGEMGAHDGGTAAAQTLVVVGGGGEDGGAETKTRCTRPPPGGGGAEGGERAGTERCAGRGDDGVQMPDAGPRKIDPSRVPFGRAAGGCRATLPVALPPIPAAKGLRRGGRG